MKQVVCFGNTVNDHVLKSLKSAIPRYCWWGKTEVAFQFQILLFSMVQKRNEFVASLLNQIGGSSRPSV